MATYAAFKHVELYNVGKAKKRVLKPPGGGSSDIFAADSPTTPRSMKNRMQSNIFTAPSTQMNGGSKNGTAAKAQKSDSHDRLFGEVSRSQITPTKNHMKSSIPFGNGEKATNGTNGHSNGTNGGARTNGHSNGNGSASSSSSTNGDAVDMAPVQVTRKVSAIKSIDRKEKKIIRRDDGPMSCNQMSPMSSLSSTTSTTSASSSALSPPPVSVRSALRLNSSFRRRNPVTGEGCISKDMMIWGGGVGAKKLIGCDANEETVVVKGYQRPRKIANSRKESGNPVTGEGFKPEINTTVPSLNGTNMVINKNRIPPGGFSSGLW